MKQGLYALVAVLSFGLGWHHWDPMERNRSRSRAMATAEKLVELDAAIKAYCRANKTLPKTLSELCQNGFANREDIVDDWGADLFYATTNGNTAVVWSCGPDSALIREGELDAIGIHYRLSKTILVGAWNCDE